jgi:hypothetical protein
MASSAAQSRPAFRSILVVGVPFHPRLTKLFPNSTLIHHPNGRRNPIPEEDMLHADAIVGSAPANLQHRNQAPELKFVQLHSAGADSDLGRPIWDEVQRVDGPPEVLMATAAGVHTSCIPQVCNNCYYRS